MKPEQAKAILADAPEGATHATVADSVDSHATYFKWRKLDEYDLWNRKTNVWSDIYRPVKKIHALSDLRQIAEQAERIEAQTKYIKELEELSRRF